MKNLKAFWSEEEGMGTVEIVLIIAVLVAIVLIFRTAIMTFITNAVESVFGDASQALNTSGQ